MRDHGPVSNALRAAATAASTSASRKLPPWRCDARCRVEYIEGRAALGGTQRPSIRTLRGWAINCCDSRVQRDQIGIQLGVHCGLHTGKGIIGRDGVAPSGRAIEQGPDQRA